MMDEAENIKRAVKPDQILMVVDAMTGQDVVNVAAAFAERVDFNGVIMSKMDGDARGGGALSIKQVTGKPIKFISAGEKPDSLEEFHPDRMAKRILGMGDVVSLIESAVQACSRRKWRQEQAEAHDATSNLNAERLHRDEPPDTQDGRRARSSVSALPGGDKALGLGPSGRRGARPHGGHHQLHDEGRAREARPAERQPPRAHRRGRRRVGDRGEPAHQEVQRDQEDDEEVRCPRPRKWPAAVAKRARRASVRAAAACRACRAA